MRTIKAKVRTCGSRFSRSFWLHVNLLLALSASPELPQHFCRVRSSVENWCDWPDSNRHASHGAGYQIRTGTL